MSSSSLYPNRNLSLTERKKLQWAKEREELSELGVNFGNQDTTIYFDHSYPRYRAIAKSSSDNNTITSGRRPSLPPLCRNSQDGTTSGYVSAAEPPNTAGYESSSSGTDRLGTVSGGDRPRWQQRIHNNAQLSDSAEVGAPNWVRRALERETDEGGPGVIVANSSPAESPDQQQIMQQQQIDGDSQYSQQDQMRPGTATSTTCNRSYVRGQNVYIDPGELEVRERRRQLALEHQEAVRAQLEDRERQKILRLTEDRRREQEEEARVRRDQELEEERKRQERSRANERMKREIQRKEALKEAIALAELQAKEERLRQRRQRLDNLHNISENVLEIDKLSLTDRNNKINDEMAVNHNHEEPISNNINHSSISTPSSTNNTLPKKSIILKSADNNNIQYVLQPDDNLALVLPAEDIQMQNLHLATIVPLSVTSTPRKQFSFISEERVLTPTIYRFQTGSGTTHLQSSTGKVLRDVGTQTDPLPPPSQSTDISLRETDPPSPMNNNMSVNGKQLLRTTRNSTTNTNNNNTDVETPTRPKWGVNRPPTRYLKQSEKDLLCVQQQRRTRPRHHQRRSTNEDKRGQSSDDSGSPRISQRSTRRVLSHRTSTALWRQQRDMMHVTEVVPFMASCCCCSRRCCHQHRCNQTGMVAMTTQQECCYVQQQQLQQPIQNQMLQLPDVNVNRTSVSCSTGGVRMCCGTNAGSTVNTDDVLQKLQSLHNGLAMKQAQFESYSSTV